MIVLVAVVLLQAVASFHPAVVVAKDSHEAMILGIAHPQTW
jgi:hypothetical protein